MKRSHTQSNPPNPETAVQFEHLRHAIQLADLEGTASSQLRYELTGKTLHLWHMSGTVRLRIDVLIERLRECGEFQLCDFDRRLPGDRGQIVWQVKLGGEEYRIIYHLAEDMSHDSATP